MKCSLYKWSSIFKNNKTWCSAKICKHYIKTRGHNCIVWCLVNWRVKTAHFNSNHQVVLCSTDIFVIFSATTTHCIPIRDCQDDPTKNRTDTVIQRKKQANNDRSASNADIITWFHCNLTRQQSYVNELRSATSTLFLATSTNSCRMSCRLSTSSRTNRAESVTVLEDFDDTWK